MRALNLPGLPLLLAAVLLTACAPATEAVRGDPPLVTEPTPDGDSSSHLVIAEIALQRGDYHTAAKEYVAAARLSDDAALAEQATRVAYERGQTTSVAAAARRWLELKPDAPDAHRYLAVAALRLHRIDESAREFEHLLRTAYESPAKGFEDLTGVLIDEDDSYGAYLVTKKLVAGQPKVPEAQYALGVAALRAYNYSLATAAAKRAVALKKDFPEAQRLLARCLVVSGKTEAGLQMARDRVKQEGDAAAQVELAMLLVASGDDAAARKDLQQLLDVPEARAEALRVLATLELSSGKFDEASKYFQELAGTGRYVPLAFYSLGAIHERRREELRAVRYYMRVTNGPYAVNSQLRAAKLLALSDQSEQANQLLDDYVVEHPEAESDMAVGRARLLMDEGDSATALTLIDAARDRYPDTPSLTYARAITLERLDRSDEAIAELKAWLDKRPGDPVALNALGYTMAEHQREVPVAHQMIRDSLAMTPDNPAVQDSLGWALFRSGNSREALKWLERSYSTQKDPEIAAHIGEVYWNLGDRAKARAIWDEAFAEDPTHRYLQETMRRHPE